MKQVFFYIFIFSILSELNAQNVGIGTTAPQSKLHIASTDTAMLRVENTTALATGVSNGLFFKTGNWFSGGIKQTGTGVNTSRTGILGYGSTNISGLKEYMSITDAGNVGINKIAPTEKLDVNGNINLSGDLKVDGNAGTANQTLMKDATNNLVWADLSSYKNFITFTCVNTVGGAGNCSSTWTVPSGVTTIFVELWGGGGGGASFSGGGSGGYLGVKLTVTAGSVATLSIGAEGDGGSAAINGATGGSTNFILAGQNYQVYGGNGGKAGDPFSGTIGSISPSYGGGYTLGGNPENWVFYNGATGGISKLCFIQISATEFGKTVVYGDGGDAPFIAGSGGRGGYRLSSTSISQSIGGAASNNVGGGGGAENILGGNGGAGRIIIHY